jgi:flagellar hook-basal body complex protein FliE
MAIIQPLTQSNLLQGILDKPGSWNGSTSGDGVKPSFGDVVSGFIQHANDIQQKGDAMAEALALGEPVDIHQVMLALNEASNALHLTMQVRSKILEAYQDLMHTQI